MWLVGLVALGATAAYALHNERDWAAYKAEHGCMLTGEDRHIVVYGGRAPQTVHQFEWDCHDGEEHWHR
jgi:hypothetical protein